jgi:hypothetical protein
MVRFSGDREQIEVADVLIGQRAFLAPEAVASNSRHGQPVKLRHPWKR